jgi:putative membrane protein
MKTVTTIPVAIVGVIHVAIAMVEMFFWETPFIYARLRFTPDIAHQVAPIVNNAGLYNAFMAAGLLWGAFNQNRSIRLFFLVCVIVAGLYGAVTLKPTTLVLQTLPATIALIFVWQAHSQFKL